MDVGIYQGKVEDPQKFGKYEYDESSEYALLSKDGEFDGNGMASVMHWRIKTTLESHAIFRFTPKENLKLTISHPKLLNQNSWIDDAGIYFSLSVKCDQKIYELWNRPITYLPQEADKYGAEVYLQPGDVAYYVFGSEMAYQRNLEFYPTFTGDASAYTEEEYNAQDFAAAKALIPYKIEVKNKLQNYVGTLSEEDYSLDSWQRILNFLEEAEAAIDEATSKEDVDALYNEAIANIDAVNTKEDDVKEIAAIRSEKLAELKNYYDSLTKSDYSEAGWASIEEAYLKAVETINKATTKTACSSAITSFKAAVNRAEKATSSGGGCGGIVTSASIITGASLVILAGVIALVRYYKSRKEN